MDHQSILDLFLSNAAEDPDKPAAMVKRSGAYQDVSWAELAEGARSISAGLIGLGVKPGERVCVISDTRVEWIHCDMGILGAGAVTVPIYPSNLADECQYIIDDAGAVVVFAENADQVAKFRAERARMPTLQRVIQIDGDPADDGWVMSLRALVALGEAHTGELEERRQSLDGDSALTIIYTSGTTGRPKGVVTTHSAMLYQARVISEVDVVRQGDVQLLFLPLAHSFAKVLEIGWFATRHVMAFAESITTIKENLGETRPTLMCGVPRIFEKFHAAVVQKGVAAGGLKAQMFNEALRLSELNGEAERNGRRLSGFDGLKFRVLKKLVFEKIRQGLGGILGGRMRLMVSGGAPLSPKINWFFRDAGLTILEGYGLTETSAGTFVNRPDTNRIGTVGQVMPGTDVKIAGDGEILIRGPGVMREYWNKSEATAEVIQNGWFHTGDIGVIDKDGYLRITDRKKDIIVTAGGKNVAPQNIENLLKTHELISQVVVHGDKRKFLSALITLDPDALKSFASAHALGNGSYADLTQKPEVYTELRKVVEAFNQQLASYETVKKFKILEQDFSQDTGELTPTLKVKRKVINERYQSTFDGFYQEAY